MESKETLNNSTLSAPSSGEGPGGEVMIIVIADDITGAAEMGGIALRHGLRVIVSEDVNNNGGVDVLVLYTNTRSMKENEAVQMMKELTVKAMELKPAWFYKKTDSVLRGHVLAEIEAQMEVLGLKKALLVPVNPSLGRVIKNGLYYINGQLIHKTGFAFDPEFPIQSSEVQQMLGREGAVASVIEKSSPVKSGISVGAAETNEEVTIWAEHMDENTLPAGGASFFNALLAKKFLPKPDINEKSQLSHPVLLISGTAFKKNVERIKEHSDVVSYMPDEIFSGETPLEKMYEEWCRDIISILQKNKKAIIAIDNSKTARSDPNLLKDKLSRVVRLVFEQTKIEELLIEGGSTAYAVVKNLGWNSFVPTQELKQGIVRMKVDQKENIYLTIKPGSYDWPPEWNFN